MINKLKLDPRLQSLVSYIEKDDIVADIGTDHGLVPIFLLINKIASRVIATDIALSPLESAKMNAKRYNVCDYIQFVQTDGINNLPLDIDKVIIAGMGGHLISKIIKESQYETLILEPNSHADVLRKTLCEIGYMIVDEKVVKSKNKYYEIIVAKKGSMSLSQEEMIYGPINIKNKDDEFINYLHDKLEKLEKIDAKSSKVTNDIKMIKDILK